MMLIYSLLAWAVGLILAVVLGVSGGCRDFREPKTRTAEEIIQNRANKAHEQWGTGVKITKDEAAELLLSGSLVTHETSGGPTQKPPMPDTNQITWTLRIVADSVQFLVRVPGVPGDTTWIPLPLITARYIRFVPR